MIESKVFYGIVCDGCGKQFDGIDDSQYWDDIGFLEQVSDESGWIKIGNKHYCPNCYHYDENLDKYVPNKKG